MANQDNTKSAQAIAMAMRSRLESKGIIKKRTRWIPHTPHPKQQLFLDQEGMEVLFGGAAGGGKSDALLMSALEHVDVPGYAALILRRTFPQLENADSLIPRSHEWLSGTGAEWSERRHSWKFPSGAIIQFGHLETDHDVHNYQSAAFQKILFDELTQFTEFSYTYLFSRLRRHLSAGIPLQMRGGTNPGDEGSVWVFERFIEDAVFSNGVGVKEVDEHGEHFVRYFIPSKLEDNPSLDAISYAQALNKLDPVTRAQLLQGDWSIRRRGNIFPMYDERLHVITWDEFAKVFGSPHIPLHWKLGRGHDWGADHPAVVTWVATAAENSPLPGTQYLYRGRMFQNATDKDIAEEIKLCEGMHGEGSRMIQSVMSHEALGARNNYERNHGLIFEPWKPDRTGGISILRDYLQINNLDRQHPFRPQFNGSPKLFLVVDNNQGACEENPLSTCEADKWIVQAPKDDRGLARHRGELAAYRWATPKSGDPSAMPFPIRVYNDAIDSLRGLAARFFPPVAPFTDDEKLEASLPEQLRRVEILRLQATERAELWLAREVELGASRKLEFVEVNGKLRGIKANRKKPVWM